MLFNININIEFIKIIAKKLIYIIFNAIINTKLEN